MHFIRLVLLRLLRAAISIASLIITAKFIGVSLPRDAWVLALSVIGILSVFLFNPTLEIFRAKVIHLRGELSKQEADMAISSYVTFSILIAVLAIVIVAIAPGTFAAAIGADASSALSGETGRFLRWGAVYILLTQLINAWSAILNSENMYVQPELIGIGTAALNVVFLLALVKDIGADALLWSTLASSTLQVVLLALLLKRSCGTIFVTYKLNLAYAWYFVAPALPLYFAFGAGQVSLIVEKNLLVLAGAGAVSIYDYARKFADVPFGVITATAASLVGPMLAKVNVSQDENEFIRAALRHLKAFILILLPITVVFSLGGSTLVSVFFSNSASVTEDDQHLISQLLGVLGWGLLGVAIYAVGSQTLIARGQITLYARLGLLTQVLNIVISLFFYRAYGAVAIAVAWGLSYGLTGFLMQYYARIPAGSILGAVAKTFSCHLVLVILYRMGGRFLPAKFEFASLIVLLAISSAMSLIFIHRDAKKS